MFPTGVSMLWERTDAVGALRDRFDFDTPEELTAWLAAVLGAEWGARVDGSDRVLISHHNAIAWVDADRGPLVVKVCAAAPLFDRLAASAEVVLTLARAGIPVAAPLRSLGGSGRVVIESGRRPLSVVALPRVDGELLDARDAAGVRAAGAVLARLHEAAAGLDPGPLAEPLPVDRSSGTVAQLRRDPTAVPPVFARAPRASARLRALLAALPDLEVRQLVHNDYRGTNVVMAGSEVAAVLDFDEMGVGHPLEDLARAAVMLATRFTTWDPAPPSARDELCAGYRSVRSLSAVEEGWLEALVLGFGIDSIPAGDDPAGWADAVEHGL